MTTPDETKPAADSQTKPVTDQAQRFQDVADQIRQRADLTAKALGGLGTTVLTAIGIAKVGDIFPWPPDKEPGPKLWDIKLWFFDWTFSPTPRMALFAVIAGFGLMALVLAFFTRRLWLLNEPIIMRSDLTRLPDLNRRERSKVEEIYDEIAEFNGVESLRAYEARAHRFENVAASNPTLAAGLGPKASQIEGEVVETLTRARLVVVRQRARDAILDGYAQGAYGLFIVGVLFFAIGADYLDSRRSAEVDLAKKCGEARTAKATALELPPICEDPVVISSEQLPRGSRNEEPVETVAVSRGEVLTLAAQLLPDITSTIADTAATAEDATEVANRLTSVVDTVLTTVAETASKELITWGAEELKQLSRRDSLDDQLHDLLLDELTVLVNDGANWRFDEAELRQQLSELVRKIVERTSTTIQHSINVRTCGSRSATIVGTTAPDTLTGTAEADVIVGRNGRDKVDGKGGKDVVCGSNGADVITGGKDIDRIFGGSGDDWIVGGKADDTLRGIDGHDSLLGMDGFDIIDGGPGRDDLRGGRGADHGRGGRHHDRVFGGRGNDRLRGGRGHDVLHGGPGQDLCRHRPGRGYNQSC